MSKLSLEQQITRFIKSGFKLAWFTHDLYNWFHLDLNIFIAHYGREGFYEARFNNWNDYVHTVETLNKCNNRLARHFINEIGRWGDPQFKVETVELKTLK
jgi:hypothetical protein